MACKHPSCPFLDLLPAEIRLEFYTYLLTFSAPLKLRQVVPGSRDLAILRTNRQIHDEASEVLFELNTIVVTRNDFCTHTSPTLQSPLPRSRARNLHIATFNVSIACTLRGRANRCAVCQPSAAGLWEAFRAMPKLKGVTLDFGHHGRELAGLMEAVPGLVGNVVVEQDGEGGRRWRELVGEEVRGLRVRALGGLQDRDLSWW